MLWLVRWLILFGVHAQDVRDLSDRFAPTGLARQSLGRGGDPCAGRGPTPRDRVNPRDDAMGPLGAGGAP